MKIAVTIGVFNEKKNIGVLIDALLAQSLPADEIIITDDGSTDQTATIIKDYAAKHCQIKYIYQKNAGPAIARNRAWKASSSDMCVFTDGDCLPKINWLEELLKCFVNEQVAAVGGTYYTINSEYLLARFIGLEIDWKYQKVTGEIDAHGSYNLAVRKDVLTEFDGFNENYPVPSGEDWDLTYKISQKYKILFNKNAIVGHYHPQDLCWYIKNQFRRSYDRMRVYQDFPQKKSGDVYTPRYLKYQILTAGLIPVSFPLLAPCFAYSAYIPLFLLLILVFFCLIPARYFYSRDKKIIPYSIIVQIARTYAWICGIILFYLKKFKAQK